MGRGHGGFSCELRCLRSRARLPLQDSPKSVEKTVPMDLWGLFANCCGSLLLAPRDAHKRVAEFMNRLFHPNDKFVGRHLAKTVLMGLVQVYAYDEVMADSREE